MNLRKASFICYCLLVFCYCSLKAQDLSNFKSLKPFQVYGSMGVRAGTYYNSSGFNMLPPRSYMLLAQPVFNLYGVSLPFNLIYSNQQVVFRQPFNQIGISPSYKWFTLHAGFRNLYFHKYTLAGHQIFGTGFEVNPGKWKLAFITGRFNKATRLDTLQSNYFLPSITFNRKGMAGLIRYGKDRGHVALSFVKAIDDSGSVAGFADYFAKGLTNTSPSENLAVGMSFKLPIVKNLFVEGESGISLLTKDLTTPIDINLNNTRKPNKLFDFVNRLIHINVTSNYFTAFETRLSYYNLRGVNAFFEVKRIDPNYTSMGAYFFQSDIQSYLLGCNFPFLKRKFRFSGSLGRQNDNINQIKMATSTRWIGSANLGYSSRKFSVDAYFNNYSNHQVATVRKYADSLRITQDNLSLSLSPRIMIDNKNASHTFSLTLASNVVKDFNQGQLPEYQKRKLATQTANLYYQVYFLQENLSISSGINYTNFDDQQGYGYKSWGTNLSTRKTFFNRKFETALSGGFFKTNRTSGTSVTKNININMGYNFTRKLKLDVGFMYNNTPSVFSLTGSGYDSEVRTETNLIYTF